MPILSGILTVILLMYHFERSLQQKIKFNDSYIESRFKEVFIQKATERLDCCKEFYESSY